MAEALVSAIIEQLVSIIRLQAEEEVKLMLGADEDVRKLTSNFQAIQQVLDDAEQKQVKENSVRDWLDKLKDVSYDIDDVLDEWKTAIQKLRITEAENASKPLQKVCSSLIPCCYGFCCRRVVVRHDIASKIKNLNNTLEVMAVEKDRFSFSVTKDTEVLERHMTTSFLDVSEVHGRDEDNDRVVNLLLSESNQGPTMLIISIVDLTELETVVHNIHQSIQGKKFLLVLDDVWTENPNHWVTIKHSLRCGAPGSKILMTTCKENVANVIGTTRNHMIKIGTLPENECWSLFNQIALFERTVEECEELKEIGKKIVQRCKGLPLAVKTLGGLLRSRSKLKDWESVLDSELWELEEVKRGVFPPLLLSYYDLPPRIRKCFSYCAIFPKDYDIYKEELIRFWMAQDYLKVEASKDEELVGENYFEILASRSFSQDFKEDIFGRMSSCKMHDLMHDFAQFLTKNECLIIDGDKPLKYPLEPYKKTRYSMICGENPTSIPTSIYTLKKLRSLLVKPDSSFGSHIDFSKLFDQLTCLRSLCFNENKGINKLPRGIEKLLHLRYLELFSAGIEELPEELCELHNLRTLILVDCIRLQKLPEGIGKLINLRQLYFLETSVRYMPKGVERLTCLRALCEFVVSDGSKACKLGCLKNYAHLKYIRIKGLGNVGNMGDLEKAEFHHKKNLLWLSLNFEGRVNVKHQLPLEALQPPPTLELLNIENYKGKTVSPSWLLSLTKLLFVCLEDFPNCEYLPPLGKLPSLETLFVEEMNSLRRVGNEFLGVESDGTTSIAFPKLKSLTLRSMDKWEVWDYEITETGEHVTIMPCLRSLVIKDCPKLKSIPSCHLVLDVSASNNFDIDNCPLLEEYLAHAKLNERDGMPSPQLCHTNLHYASANETGRLQLPSTLSYTKQS